MSTIILEFLKSVQIRLVEESIKQAAESSVLKLPFLSLYLRLLSKTLGNFGKIKCFVNRGLNFIWNFSKILNFLLSVASKKQNCVEP